MSVNINLNDGSKFELLIKKIQLISVEKNKLKINYERKEIIIENNLLESFTFLRPTHINDYNSSFIAYSNILTTILTNILHNSKKNIQKGL